MTDQVLLAAIDTGNGKVAALSSAMRGAISNVVRFEPVIAPLTTKRGTDDSLPRYTLRVDDSIYVFGVDDVFAHGKRNQARRSNNAERYGSADYMMLIKVALLQIFAQYRGKDAIKPTIMLTVPIAQYNDEETVNEIKSALCSVKTIEDREGCVLRLNLSPKQVIVIPESTGAFTHYAFDAKSLNPRQGSTTTGVTAVVDIGYLTTNIAMLEGMAYQRDKGFTVPRGGFNVVVNEVYEWIVGGGVTTDISRLDRGLNAAAGIASGKKKNVDIGGGYTVDVAPMYDQALANLARLIVDNLLNAYGETLSRVLITGGGAYHLERVLRDMLSTPVVTAPDPELANVLGAYTLLRQSAARKGVVVTE